ncbi:MAG: HAMP domain-containing sensor histidine kinase [Candidatus Promineifilaceae bacterium]
MKTLRSRFIFSHIIPILVVIPLAGIALIYLLESQVLLSELSDDLTERANIIAEAVSGQPELLQNPELAASYITRIQLNIEGEVLFLGSKGTLLATSDPDLREDIGQIPEIDGLDSAVAGIPSVVLHYSWSQPSGTALVPVSDVNQQLVGVVGVTERLDAAASQFGDLRRLIVLAILIALVIGVGLALILARRLERPLVSVTDAVGEIAEGRRTEPIAEEGPEEIQNLIRSVNVLAANLRSLEDTRRRLLANLVHELGRPLGAIRAAIHALRKGAAEDQATQDELLMGIEDEVIRMQPLLDDLAQLHGQVMGQVRINPEEVALSDWLPPLIIPWRAAALDKGLHWEAQIPRDLPTIIIDPDRIGQVIGNLLSNAIKYTPEGGSVRFSASSTGDKTRISVSDNGPGIALGEHERVFEPFYRSQDSRRFPQGLGLGLTIARDLVEAHGGQLEISSQIGKGSDFVIILPVEPD